MPSKRSWSERTPTCVPPKYRGLGLKFVSNPYRMVAEGWRVRNVRASGNAGHDTYEAGQFWKKYGRNGVAPKKPFQVYRVYPEDRDKVLSALQLVQEIIKQQGIDECMFYRLRSLHLEKRIEYIEKGRCLFHLRHLSTTKRAGFFLDTHKQLCAAAYAEALELSGENYKDDAGERPSNCTTYQWGEVADYLGAKKSGTGRWSLDIGHGEKVPAAKKEKIMNAIRYVASYLGVKYKKSKDDDPEIFLIWSRPGCNSQSPLHADHDSPQTKRGKATVAINISPFSTAPYAFGPWMRKGVEDRTYENLQPYEFAMWSGLLQHGGQSTEDYNLRILFHTKVHP